MIPVPVLALEHRKSNRPSTSVSCFQMGIRSVHDSEGIKSEICYRASERNHLFHTQNIITQLNKAAIVSDTCCSGGYVRRRVVQYKVVIQIISGLSTKIVDEIEFGLLSPDEIRKMSVAQIVVADTYDEDGYPIENSTACLTVYYRE